MSAPHGFGIGRVGAGMTDLDLGRSFYEALGFVAGPPFDLGTTLADQSETPGSPLIIQIVRRDGICVVLDPNGVEIEIVGPRAPGRP